MAKYIHLVLKLPDPYLKLLAFAKLILTALTGNTKFPNAPISTLADEIKAAEKALQGSGADRAAAREALRETLEHTKNHVQGVAEKASGTVDILAIQALVESAGMDLRKVGAHAKQVFAATNGPSPGSVALTAPASPKRDPHEWEMSTDQQSWSALTSTRQAKTMVKGLPVGVTYYFRHRVITKDGPTEWSDPIMTVVK